MNKKYHLVYKTINTVNNKIYIGLHSTDNLNDRYIGSGKLLKHAINKYGKEKFTCIHLCIFFKREFAREFEAKLVDTSFCKRKDTYNLIEGGGGVGNQTGSRNHRYGKVGVGAKKVRAEHLDGTIELADSIQQLSSIIGIDRVNIRNLIKKKIRGRLGWKVTLLEDIV